MTYGRSRLKQRNNLGIVPTYSHLKLIHLLHITIFIDIPKAYKYLTLVLHQLAFEAALPTHFTLVWPPSCPRNVLPALRH